MKSIKFVIAAIFALGFSVPVFADEVGPGKPGTNSTETTTMSTDCGYIDSVLGLCEDSSSSE